MGTLNIRACHALTMNKAGKEKGLALDAINCFLQLTTSTTESEA